MGKLVTETYDPDMLDLPNDTDFEEEGIGEEYETYREYQAYLPDHVADLRPLSREALDACAAAERALAGLWEQLPGGAAGAATAELLLVSEAVSTAQIENYTATCASTLEYLASESIRRAWSESEAAATDALDALRSFALGQSGPITLEDLCAADALFTKSNKTADECGVVRERPVFVGASLFDADFVATPVEELDDCLADLVGYVASDVSGLSPVAKAAIAYVQFVTIHPFMDGNGRTGRALAQRLLREAGLIDALLPTSAVTVAHAADYIDMMNRTRNNNGPADLSEAVTFFARVCEQAAQRELALARRVGSLLATWEGYVGSDDVVGIRAVEAFAARPVMSEPMLRDELGDGTAHAIDLLCDFAFLRKQRSRYDSVDLYVAGDFLDALTSSQLLRLPSPTSA